METISEIMARVSKQLDAQKAAYNPDALKVGDIIEFYHKPYQHCACMKVTKVNSKTFKAVEIRGSYKQGREWTVYKSYKEIRMSNRTEV